MKQMILKNSTTWMTSALTMAFCMALNASPSFAEDRVVVIPMGKSGAPAPVAKTGQTTSSADGDDGDLQKGAAMAAGRFVDNNNGTVTDKLTGLIWLKEGQCQPFFSGDAIGINNRSWVEAIEAANKLASGYCGLNDGSKAGDWRLPNLNELASLLDRGQYFKALPVGCPLTATTVSLNYWSATTFAGNSTDMWAVHFGLGSDGKANKSNSYYVRCVRAGQ
jgi:hypothetical protein